MILEKAEGKDFATLGSIQMEALSELEGKYSQNTQYKKTRLDYYFTNNEYSVFKIEENEQIIGYCVVYNAQNPKYVEEIYIKNRFRLKALQRKIIDQILEIIDVETE